MKQILTSNIDPNWPNIEIDYELPVRLYIDYWDDYNPFETAYRILYLREPDEVSRMAEIAIRQSWMFDLILTTNHIVLESCQNAMILEFGTKWVFDYGFPEKKFQISALVGNKELTDGHRLRKKLYYSQREITNPTDFYISRYGGVDNVFGNKILGDKKDPLFDSQFHVCIENTRQDYYYFSEKVMDCFATKTVPIFWGCPKIGNYFDLRGMIIVNNLEEIISSCNSLTEETYYSMLPYVEENYKRHEKWVDLPARMKNAIEWAFVNIRQKTRN